jgi:hypothetical protein
MASRANVRPLVLAVLCVAACTDSTVEPGILNVQRQTTIQAPSTVHTNEAFIVSITTWGDGCIELHSTDVELSADGATITPYDEYSEGSCVLILAPIHHEASVTFKTLGEKTIVVRGRDAQHNPAEVMRSITVE